MEMNAEEVNAEIGALATTIRPSVKPLCISSHHGDVEGPHAGELRDLAGDVAPFAQRQRVTDASRVRGVLHVLQALRPGGRTHQPQEDQDRRDHKVLETRDTPLIHSRLME